MTYANPSIVDEKLEELVALLRAHAYKLFICTYNIIEEVQFIENSLKEKGKGKLTFLRIDFQKVYDIRKLKGMTGVDRIFGKRILENRNSVLLLHGIDNNRVELLLKFISTIIDPMIVIWIEEKNLSGLLLSAPDFFLSSTIFRFGVRRKKNEIPLILLSFSRMDEQFVLKLNSILFKRYDAEIETYVAEPSSNLEEVSTLATRLIFMPILSDNYTNSSFYRYHFNKILNNFKFNLKATIVPILCERIEIPTTLREYDIIDFTDFEKGKVMIKNLQIPLKLVSNQEDALQDRREFEAIKEVLQISQKMINIKEVSKPVRFREEGFFVGRENDISEIKKFFSDSNDPISIIGENGIGKSALAFKAIRSCEDLFDCIIPIYIQSGFTIDELLIRLARVLSLPIEKFSSVDLNVRKETLKHALSRNRRPLIFLDNYEHITKALNNGTVSANAKEVNAFLSNVPSNTCILLTSTEYDNLQNERTIQLGGLNTDETRQLLINKTTEQGISSQEVDKDIETIVKKSEGHPLSIEILALNYNWSEHKGLEQIRRPALKDPISWTEIIPKQFEKIPIEHVVSNLDKEHRRVLELLLNFQSPFPSSAVSSIFGINNEAIGNLYNLNLLTRIDSDRYGQLEDGYWLFSVRPAVKNRLHKIIGYPNSDLERQHREKFSQYYLSLLNSTYEATDEAQLQSLRRFSIMMEGQNNDILRSMSITNDPFRSAEIARLVGSILARLGIMTASYYYHEIALKKHAELKEKGEMAIDYSNLGLLLDEMGKFDEALEYLNKALDIHIELNDRREMAIDYDSIGRVMNNLARPYEAMVNHKKALEIHIELDDRSGMAIDYSNIGIAYFNTAQPDKALEYHKKSLELDEELNNKKGMAINSNLMIVLSYMAQFNKALEYLLLALDIHIELNDKRGMAIDYSNLGLLLDEMGKFDEALEYLKKALGIHIELNDRKGIATNYDSTGRVLTHMSRPDEALIYHNKALNLYDEIGEKSNIATTYVNIGLVFRDIGDFEKAISNLGKALEIHKEMGDRVGQADDYSTLGLVLRDMRLFEKGLRKLSKALEIHKEMGDRVGQADDYSSIGLVLRDMGDLESGLENLKKALEIHSELNDVNSMAIDYTNLGHVHRDLGRNDDAINFYKDSLSVHKQLGDYSGVAADYRNIANTFIEKGMLKEGSKYQELAIQASKGQDEHKGNKLLNWLSTRRNE